jgi:hypothetical protein
MLSVIAMGFDIIFLFQHYVLYRSAWKNEARLKRINLIDESFREMKDDKGRFVSSGEGVNRGGKNGKNLDSDID